MSRHPLVSIVTPSYNQAQYLEATIKSVMRQTYFRFEHIVIDGGSTDGSIEILEKYDHQLAYWVSEPDKGQTDAINKGFAKANGHILAWLNSDDTYEPHAMAQAVEYLEANRDIGLVYGDANFIDSAGEVIGRFPAAQTDYKRLREGYVHVPQQAAFWRAKLWRKVGPLDPDFYFAMDYDLWVRLAKISQIKYLPGVWANFRLHGDSKTIADDSAWPEMLKVHYRDGGSFFAPIVAKYYLRKVLAPLVTYQRRRRVAG
ncbi:MAG: glycosyltransferase [Chloroflexi bacterium]|nr:MAG: glycosyltransferase [Chloroflexota bacterium]MBL1194313.1 glycosyltransferase [Chloroflexota bacterium]NOH11603.1 glycosyltransferase [Chloroflexota bacterium]